MNDQTYKGGCLCGKVRFEITGAIKNIVYCHCSRCRKAQGSAFATNGNIAKDDFVFTSGKEDMTGYESTSGQIKYFCKYCGSPIISKSELNPDQVRVRRGAIESNIEERPEAHIFVTSRANWDEINDDIPQYEAYEPGS